MLQKQIHLSVMCFSFSGEIIPYRKNDTIMKKVLHTAQGRSYKYWTWGGGGGRFKLGLFLYRKYKRRINVSHVSSSS